MLNKIRKIKKPYWVIIGIILLVIILFGVRRNNQENYSNYTATRSTVSDELLLAGTIDAKDRVDLGFATSGRINAVNFEVGDTVKKGQVIAEIEQNRLTADLAQAQASYSVTQVDTSSNRQLQEQETIVSGLYQTYLSGDLQAYNTDTTPTGATPPTISGSYLGTVEGEYLLDVYNSSTSSGYSFRLSGIETKTHAAQVNQPGPLGSLGLYIQFEEDNQYGNTEWVVPVPNTRSSTYITRKTAYQNALATLNRLKNDALGSGTITRNDALRNQARAQVNAVSAQLGDGKIRAPFDGIIAKNDLEIGEIANAFSVVVVMFGSGEKELNLNIPEIYINKIKTGDLVNVTLDAYEDIVFEGTVDFIDFIDTEVDGVPVYKTDILINVVDERIRSGMNAKASIVSEQRTDVLAVPAHYIKRTDNGEEYVQVQITGDDFEERIITTGLRGNEGLVEILSGLEEGEVILLEKK